MGGTAEIRSALLARLVAPAPGAALPAASVAWENRAFAPGTARWYRATFLPGEPRAAAVGVDAPNRQVGVFQVDVFDPTNKGDAIAAAEAERIAGSYKRGTVLSAGGVSVLIRKAYRTRGDNTDPAWYMVSAIIEWQADVEN